MKRYLVFAFENYYPAGGVRDVIGAADSFIELLLVISAAVADGYPSYFQILDTAAGRWTERKISETENLESWCDDPKNWEDAQCLQLRTICGESSWNYKFKPGE